MGGSCWAPKTRPQRLRANYHKPHGSRQFYACYSVGGDELWGHFEYASRANPIEAHFGPLREFVLNSSDYRDHPALARAIRAYLRWRDANTRDPKILEAERRRPSWSAQCQFS